MIESPNDGGQSAPSRAVGISLAALLIPVVGTLALPELETLATASGPK